MRALVVCVLVFVAFHGVLAQYDYGGEDEGSQWGQYGEVTGSNDYGNEDQAAETFPPPAPPVPSYVEGGGGYEPLPATVITAQDQPDVPPVVTEEPTPSGVCDSLSCRLQSISAPGPALPPQEGEDVVPSEPTGRAAPEVGSEAPTTSEEDINPDTSPMFGGSPPGEGDQGDFESREDITGGPPLNVGSGSPSESGEGTITGDVYSTSMEGIPSSSPSEGEAETPFTSGNGTSTGESPSAPGEVTPTSSIPSEPGFRTPSAPDIGDSTGNVPPAPMEGITTGSPSMGEDESPLTPEEGMSTNTSPPPFGESTSTGSPSSQGGVETPSTPEEGASSGEASGSQAPPPVTEVMSPSPNNAPAPSAEITTPSEVPVPSVETLPAPSVEAPSPSPVTEGQIPAPSVEPAAPSPSAEEISPAPSAEQPLPAPSAEGSQAPTGEEQSPTSEEDTSQAPQAEAQSPKSEDEAKGPSSEEETKGPDSEDEAKAPSSEDEAKGPDGEEEAKGPESEEEAKEISMDVLDAVVEANTTAVVQRLETSDNVEALAEGFTFPEDRRVELLVKTEERVEDGDVVTMKAIAEASLSSKEFNKLAKVLVFSIFPKGNDTLVQEMEELLKDTELMKKITLADPTTDFLPSVGRRRRRRLTCDSCSPVNSFVCAHCWTSVVCAKFFWCPQDGGS